MRMAQGRGVLAAASAIGVLTATLAAACGGGDEVPTVTASSDAGESDAGVDAGVSLCVDGQPTADYPPGPYAIELNGVPPPDLAWSGPDGEVRLRDSFEPCAARSRLIVVRTSAAWCGTCAWHITHTKRLLGDPRFEGRLVLIDLLFADEDNMPATSEAAARWKARIDAPGKVAVDVGHRLLPVLPSKSPLPEYAFIDTRTMKFVTVASDPSPEDLADKIAIQLAELDGLPRPAAVPRSVHDDLFTDEQWDMLQDMKLVDAPPPQPTNAYADDAAAAALGATLFSDTQLSPTNTVSCATCHDPANGFADGRAQAKGVAVGDRNTPSIVQAAHARSQFWDGRADSLWAQALGPFENDKEFGSSRLFVAHQIATRYGAEYQAVFGAAYPLPDMSDGARFPAQGKPGDAAFDAMASADKDAVTRVYVNVGKAIAAFERTIRVKPNALDAYIGGDLAALTQAQKDTLSAFFKLGCAQCHWGPRMTDDAFHDVRFPTGRQDGAPDRGRIDVLATLATAEFTASSKWSDAPAPKEPKSEAPVPAMLGAFKTPSLRGIATSAPYGHGGTLITLADVAEHYGTRAKDVGDTKATGEMEPWIPPFDANIQADLPAILEVLTAEVVAP